MVTGGGRPEGLDSGWFVQPTVFADVDNSMTIAQEEIFGPVLAVIPYDTEDDAMRIANDSVVRTGRQRVDHRQPQGAGDRRARSAPAPTRSTCTRSTRARRSAATRTPASAVRTGPRASRQYCQAKSMLLPFGYTPE